VLGPICPGARIVSQFAVVHLPDLACSVGDPGRLTRSQPGSAGPSVLRSGLRRVLLSALLSAGLARSADEVEQCLVDLVGVGPDDRMGPARDDGKAGVLQQRGKPAAGGLVGQDAILVAVDDQDGDADRGQIAPEVFQASCDAAEGGVLRRRWPRRSCSATPGR